MSSASMPLEPVGDKPAGGSSAPHDGPGLPHNATERAATDQNTPVWRALLADRTAVISLAIIAIFVLAAIFAPLITAINGQDPYRFNTDALDGSGLPIGPFGGISAEHWFGVEPQNGRDLFSIVIFGAQSSLLFGLAATVVSMLLGVAFGILAGFLGGWWDRIISRATDVIIAFPSLIFLITLGAIAPDWLPKPLLLVIVVGFFGWPSIARVVRSQVLSLRSRNFIQAAQGMGASNWHIMTTGLLPNLWATIIVFTTISIPGKIGMEAALSFLGVGLPPPTPSWGRSIGTAVNWVQTDPWFLIFPGAALFLITLAFNLLGDSLRDVLDRRR